MTQVEQSDCHKSSTEFCTNPNHKSVCTFYASPKILKILPVMENFHRNLPKKFRVQKVYSFNDKILGTENNFHV